MITQSLRPTPLKFSSKARSAAPSSPLPAGDRFVLSSDLSLYPQQSPVLLDDPIYADLGDRKLSLQWASQLEGIPHKDDHGLEIDLSEQAAEHQVQLDRKNFQLQSFHFHAPSEHWLEGRPHDMELHMVHKNPEDGSLAVVGILIDGQIDSIEEDPICTFLHDTHQASETGETVRFDPHMFLPQNPEEYYRYEGSLTTAPYASNVSWVVMHKPLQVSRQQLDELKHLFEKPAREPQPLHRRFVLATFKDEGNIARR